VSLNTNLPTVAVHELAQHPSNGEMVAATHGRSLWILDVTALRQAQPKSIAKSVQLYKSVPSFQWVPKPGKGTTNREFIGENRPQGAQVYYSLPAGATKVNLTVRDADGKTVQQLKAETAAGLHKATWPLRKGIAGTKANPTTFVPVKAGSYQVVLNVDGQEYTQPVVVIADPGLPPGVTIAEDLFEFKGSDKDAKYFAD
jgi:hypothetical protein